MGVVNKTIQPGRNKPQWGVHCFFVAAQIGTVTTRKTWLTIPLVNSTARSNSTEHAINQSGNRKLRRNEPFNRGYFTDVHPENSRAICQGRHKVQRIVPT